MHPGGKRAVQFRHGVHCAGLRVQHIAPRIHFVQRLAQVRCVLLNEFLQVEEHAVRAEALEHGITDPAAVERIREVFKVSRANQRIELFAHFIIGKQHPVDMNAGSFFEILPCLNAFPFRLVGGVVSGPDRKFLRFLGHTGNVRHGGDTDKRQNKRKQGTKQSFHPAISLLFMVRRG